MKSILIHTGTWGDELYMIGLEDNSKKKQSIGFYLIDADKNMSEIISVSRSKLFTSKNPCDFAYDLAADFSRDDVYKIKNEVIKNFRSLKNVDVSEAVGIEKAHFMLCEYVINNEKPDSVFLDDEGYCNIQTTEFERILKKLETGYKKLPLLRALKVKEALKIGKGRSFDYKLYDKDGSPYWAYRLENIYKGEDDND